ncbi:MAG: acyl-CoA dehydrogenase family protein, partial [Deltaproteobacteria bacterium]|nr:acyl-CoA dehydrogenase family protein [Deltaproteobacteria bacterium]
MLVEPPPETRAEPFDSAARLSDVAALRVILAGESVVDIPHLALADREAVDRFAQEHVAPHAEDWDREARYPDQMIRLLGEQGFMGILVPEEQGGAG